MLLPSVALALNIFRSSQAARRDQNRIAQREFRLRKQQRVRRPDPFTDACPYDYPFVQIRDLEARVELLSGSQDEALIDLRAILKGVYIVHY